MLYYYHLCSLSGGVADGMTSGQTDGEPTGKQPGSQLGKQPDGRTGSQLGKQHNRQTRREAKLPISPVLANKSEFRVDPLYLPLLQALINHHFH